ncbi:ribosomal RNA small subunit methyltransferase I [Kurthia zopfii]|uniref:Ribosomal RNA small subunit methyltransferase I n=1 Tax=Kurthia zopfii TaxID=1650 RepID=A0A8B4Q6Z7_9BACL|nr:16S rRNA (cytidine(1402)-2'-O)-methyltransferase [Kurthia zopfii]TDR32119.1 16S rRNA (cytidine1402-2'-O)-methyltransferase [Kurthia zopfii]GEK32371.1 ribosomal RNA small subunit methyltransferase I [Kurthia zopfii]STX08403.1 Ribosomal RNA small subunit methyltransferase I [Kurthia zopfii]VEI05351.1 Ribosomal RNA small subunit methyltransferase I [Kurthia zopfii]
MIQTQMSSQHEKGPCLYLVPTPIGNLEDMTMRAIRILKESDVIAAEDTRNTKRLCNYFEIDTPLTSYHDHNQEQGGEKLLQMLREGKTIALVSDAGLPAISDPGADISMKAIEEGFAVVPLPGANAAITALIASGLPTQPFYFHGFLSRYKKERREGLEQLKKRQETILLYEAPHRLKDALKDMQLVLGERRIVLAREITKKFEEFIRGSIDEVIEWANENEIRGEFVIVIEGTHEEVIEEAAWWEDLAIVDHVTQLMEQKDISSKEAIKEVAKERGLQKREVYQQYHVEE